MPGLMHVSDTGLFSPDYILDAIRRQTQSRNLSFRGVKGMVIKLINCLIKGHIVVVVVVSSFWSVKMGVSCHLRPPLLPTWQGILISILFELQFMNQFFF